MTVWELICELTQHEPDAQVRANVVGEGVECFNHKTDDDDVCDIDAVAYTVNVIKRGDYVFIDIDL